MPEFDRTLVPAPGDRRGFALVIVLWLFVTLFVLGAEFAQEMRQDAQATVNFADETQSYYLASAAANLTFYRLLEDHRQREFGQKQVGEGGEPEPPLVSIDGLWHSIDLWGAPLSVRVVDESGKIAINWVDETVLRHVMGNLGVPPDEADIIADSILDWRDTDDEKRVNGAEGEYYSGLDRPYVAKNAPIDALEEILMIRGVTPDLYYGGTQDHPIGLKDIFTVFRPPSGDQGKPGKLNVRYMTPEVLRAFFGLDREELAQLLDTRTGGQAPGLLDVLTAKLGNPVLGEMVEDQERASLLAVEVQAKLPTSRVAAHIGAVVDIEESSDGIYVQRWMDQLPPVDASEGSSSTVGSGAGAA